MLRTLFMIGLMALVGLFVLKLFFGVFAGLLGVFIVLALFALKVVIIGAIAYFILRVVSPDTAKSLSEKFSGTSTSI
ncbi:MAG: hypothetical protein HYR75_02670 [Gemmatimonadetes bacterium]|nr:hypothetical protein [Gemmatimonadota bacterium]MBI3567893.1 hypothetical protein [Gemmatimonadota bacterium]